MTFNLGAGATTPMILNHRRIELGVGPQVLQTISNSNTQALTINTHLLDNSTAMARTLTLSGSGTGRSTFAGNMVEGASTLRVTKAGTGTWVLSGNNTYATWIAGFPSVAPLTGFSDHPDNDGLKNGVENFFGTNPGTFNGGIVAGAATGGTFTFTHPQNPTPASDVPAVYRWSKDLTAFNASGATDGAGTTVILTPRLNTPSPGTTTVTATVTGAAAPRLLVQVRVTGPM